ncbi:MAG: glucosamine/fructose-6-phosphate aminotransferase [Candidatus Scalindua brodae]|uniref:Glutamine--fructose-6-phosphate aminotransferase [isomerizing] n=1 Tax=Candidatus Scalindua brodae TaxID=237368 RepID=A0A0B0ELJ5_9BACT|nr:MAG: glucosamine/fructose-6-phosphate aminotransferase [Candidatus Scalindua brodae]
MCGIVGYIGDNKAAPILINGIRRLEYRGYDSSGISIIEGNKIFSEKSVGFISELEKKIDGKFREGTLGIVHTRWATHGAPTIDNAHPHIDCTGKISVVHNGIIENYNYLKAKLKKEGHSFKSETDSEVIAHLIESYFEGTLEDAVRLALKDVEGAYGVAIISLDDPGKLIAARRGSPLIVGIGEREHYVTSDVAAILEYTKEVVYLDDNEIVVLTRDNMKTTDINNVQITKRVDEVQWNLDKIEKCGYEHFMLKEIYEQPQSLRDAMLGRFEKDSNHVHLGGLIDKENDFRNTRRIIIVACGTSWNAGLIGEYMIEEHLGIPVEVEYASEFRYRNPIIEADTMVIAISQSGETADTLAAIHEPERRALLFFRSVMSLAAVSQERQTVVFFFTRALKLVLPPRRHLHLKLLYYPY